MALAGNAVDVSVVVPVYNGARWVERCFSSVLSQSALRAGLTVELVVFDDASADKTPELLEAWKVAFADSGVRYIVLHSEATSPKGVGAAKNEAVKNSSGQYLCFQDIDDVMLPDRIILQYEAAKQRPHALVGSKFRRDPIESTARFTDWANRLERDKLNVQIYTSHGPTIIMPTWFCHRNVYNRVGGFDEAGIGTPEDLIFFLKHIDMGGEIFRVEKELLIYTYHMDATTFSVQSDTIWDIRMRHLEDNILIKWPTFTVWNAGKQGRKFVKSLSNASQDKVQALCDIDSKKVGKSYQLYCARRRKFVKTFPIIHYKDALPPIVVCVKMGMTHGEFEENLKSMNLTEGSDYMVFS